MVPVVMILKCRIESASDPATPAFWFVMSMGLLAGFILAYPMNWWLATYHLKHGMMTVRPALAAAGGHGHGAKAGTGDASGAELDRRVGGGEAPSRQCR
jgi:hypothetical protein